MNALKKDALKPSLAVMFIVTVLWGGVSSATDTYPHQPITIVCGWAPGSMHDTLIRVISRAAEKELGQPIVNENKPGAGGVIAKAYVVKAKPDGYTLGTTVTATYIIQPQIRKVPYDPFKRCGRHHDLLRIQRRDRGQG